MVSLPILPVLQRTLDAGPCGDLAFIVGALVLELARSEYVTRRENIIAVGNSGTGKTHICLDRSRGLPEGVVGRLQYRRGSRP